MFLTIFLQSNLEVLGSLRERQLKLKEDALVLQEQMTEFRNNIVKEVHVQITNSIFTYIVYQVLSTCYIIVQSVVGNAVYIPSNSLILFLG